MSLPNNYRFVVSSRREDFALLPNDPFIANYKFISYQGKNTKLMVAILYNNNLPSMLSLIEKSADKLWILKHSTFGVIHELSSEDTADKYFLKKLIEFAQHKSITEINIKLPSLMLYANTSNLLQKALELGFETSKTEVNAVIHDGQLKPTKGRKAQIKRGSRLGSISLFENSLSEQDYDIIVRNLNSHDAKPLHTIIELNGLAERFVEKVRFHRAFLNGRPESIVVTFDYGVAIHTQYIASTLVGKKQGLQDFLLSRLVNEASVLAKKFSFGTSNDPETNEVNHGLLAYKKSFGAQDDLKFTLKKYVRL